MLLIFLYVRIVCERLLLLLRERETERRGRERGEREEREGGRERGKIVTRPRSSCSNPFTSAHVSGTGHCKFRLELRVNNSSTKRARCKKMAAVRTTHTQKGMKKRLL